MRTSRDKKSKNYKSMNPGFLYIIRLDKIAVPTWGKVGFSINPEERVSQAKTWWPDPKLVWKHPSEKGDESKVMILMQDKLGCSFFDSRVINSGQLKHHELFECTNWSKLIDDLNRYFEKEFEPHLT